MEKMEETSIDEAMISFIFCSVLNESARNIVKKKYNNEQKQFKYFCTPIK